MSQRRPPSGAHAVVIGGPALFFLVVWAFRWLSIGAVENDHFVALARAHQLLYGDWPVRDFADPGQPRRNHAVIARRVTDLAARVRASGSSAIRRAEALASADDRAG